MTIWVASSPTQITRYYPHQRSDAYKFVLISPLFCLPDKLGQRRLVPRQALLV